MASAADTERRRTERFFIEPLRVRVQGTREGILVDLSEAGALVLFPSELQVGREMRLSIEWEVGSTVQVPARVKRCLGHPVRLPSATLARTQYDIAVEFLDMPPATAAAIRRILQANSAA